MTFDPSKPNSAESPSLFPPENQTNMARLQTLFSANHQFNASAAANDGWHTVINYLLQTADPATAASVIAAYTKTNAQSSQPEIYYRQQSSGTVSLGSFAGIFMPVVAFGRFSNMSAASPTIDFARNISAIARTAGGIYNITFTSQIAAATYAVIGIASVTGSTVNVNADTFATTGCRINTVQAGVGNTDPTTLHLCFLYQG